MEVAFFVCALLLLLFGLYVGFSVGSTLGERATSTADYWKLNAGAVIVTVLLSFVLAGLPLLYGAIIGLLAGCIAGLKMGFGESSGPWRVLDRFYNINRAHREAAESGAGKRRRRRKREGGAAPDLISVSDDAARGDDNAKNAR